MSFGWGQVADLARELIDTHGESAVPQAALRAAVSRSYYAVYCTARDRLTAQGVEVPRKKAHATVFRQYGDSPDPRDKEIGASLSRLLKQRLVADYDLSPPKPVDANLAEFCHLMAVQTLELLADRAEDGNPA